MRFGIPRESRSGPGPVERRVALSPAGVRELHELGAEVLVERGAGEGAGFTDEEYGSAGAQIVYSPQEVHARPEIILRVGRPLEVQWLLLREEATLMAFLHPTAGPPGFLSTFLQRKIREEDGSYPVQKVSSIIAGRLLEAPSGRMGILLSALPPGTPPADVVILGGGTLGHEATRAFLGLGASVYVLDIDPRRLEETEGLFAGRAATAPATKSNLEKFTAFAEVLTGATRSRGGVPIIALPSTVQGGRISRIVPYLKTGACGVTTRGDVHYVATEFGVADLYGKNLRQRARALIDIAHPRFREEQAAWKIP